MQIEQTTLAGCFIVKPNIFGDDRGYFVETFNARQFAEQSGLDIVFVQDNESMSSKNVIRGLHFQKAEAAQSKLIRVVKGCIIDVAVDLRPASPTFLQHVAVELSGENKHQLFVPRGFAHGFAVLEDNTVVNYKCDNFYNKSADGGIRYNDERLQINWQIDLDKALVSEKDLNLPQVNEIDFSTLF